MPTKTEQHRRPTISLIEKIKNDNINGVKKEWKKLYNCARWRNGRLRFLEKNPLCVICLAEDKITEANIVDHIKQHRGDEKLFYSESNWQSLCVKCHGLKTASETRAPIIVPKYNMKGLTVISTPYIDEHLYNNISQSFDYIISDYIIAKELGISVLSKSNNHKARITTIRNAEVIQRLNNNSKVCLIISAPKCSVRNEYKKNGALVNIILRKEYDEGRSKDDDDLVKSFNLDFQRDITDNITYI